MTEFELASLHSAMYVQAQSALSTLLTVLSGFLVVSYFAAHRIDLTMTTVGLAIYLGFSAFVVAGTARTLETYAGISQEIKAFAAAGRGLSWHGATAVPSWLLDVMPLSAFACCSIAIAGSVYFFFHCRRMNLKDQAGAWRPKV